MKSKWCFEFLAQFNDVPFSLLKLHPEHACPRNVPLMASTEWIREEYPALPLFPSGAPRTYLTKGILNILALVPKAVETLTKRISKNIKKRWKVWRRIVESCNGTSRISWQWIRKPWRCILTASWSPWCASQHNAIHIDPPLLQNVDCKRLSTETMNKCPAFPPNLCIAIVDLPLNIIMLVSNTLLILIVH